MIPSHEKEVSAQQKRTYKKEKELQGTNRGALKSSGRKKEHGGSESERLLEQESK